MKCPLCGFNDSKVIDSRPVEGNDSIRRRRECLSCHRRFTTYELVEAFQPLVIKKDGSQEYFNKNKLVEGLRKACHKRPVNAEQIANEIEAEILNSLQGEITSKQIGEMAMEKLRLADAVAYVRFASVYREFTDVKTFVDAITSIAQANTGHSEVPAGEKENDQQ